MAKDGSGESRLKTILGRIETALTDLTVSFAEFRDSTRNERRPDPEIIAGLSTQLEDLTNEIETLRGKHGNEKERRNDPDPFGLVEFYWGTDSAGIEYGDEGNDETETE